MGIAQSVTKKLGLNMENACNQLINARDAKMAISKIKMENA